MKSRSPSHRIFGVVRGPLLEKDLDNVGQASEASDVQGGNAGIFDRVDVCFAVEQGVNHAGVSDLERLVQRREAILVRFIFFRSSLDEILDDVGLVLHHAQVKRRDTVLSGDTKRVRVRHCRLCF